MDRMMISEYIFFFINPPFSKFSSVSMYTFIMKKNDFLNVLAGIKTKMYLTVASLCCTIPETNIMLYQLFFNKSFLIKNLNDSSHKHTYTPLKCTNRYK